LDGVAPIFLSPFLYRTWQESLGFFIANGANNANFSAEKTKFRVTPVLAGGARVRPHLRLAQVQVFAAFAMGLVR
jgi:hypothetical protein